MGDWGDKIENYQQIKDNPDVFELRNPIIFRKHFFNELRIDGFIIICLISLILLLFLKKRKWLR